MNIRKLVKQAKELYPDSKSMRKQWVRKTILLTSTGKHVLYGGKVNWDAYS